MQVNFTEIQIEGFRSIVEPLRLSFLSEGITLVNGKNGAGKTSVIEALFWVLYGKTLKGESEKNLITSEQYRGPKFRGTKVTLYCEIDDKAWCIERRLGKSDAGITLYCEGEELNLLDKRSTQEHLISTLGVDAEGFLSSILLGQRMARFMNASSVEKRAIFEAMLDLDFIARGKEVAKEQKRALTQELADLNREQATREREIIRTSEAIEQIKRAHESAIAQNKAQREQYESILVSLRAKREEYIGYLEEDYKLDPVPFLNTDLVKEIADVKGTRDMHRAKLSEAVAEFNGVCARIEELEQSRGKCPTCGSDTMTVEALNRAISELDTKLDSIQARVTNHKAEYKEYNNGYTLLKANQVEQMEVANENRSKQRQRETYERLLEQTTNEIGQYVTALEETKLLNLQGYSHLEDELRVLQAEVANFDTSELEATLERVSFWADTGFGANGIQQYIVKSELDKLTEYANYYASILGMTLRADIDVSKARKSFQLICTKGDSFEIDYDSLSGGEKSRIDIAIAFGLFELLSHNKVTFNVLLLDEAFTGLDEEGLYAAFDIIRQKAESVGVYIVTHKTDIDMLNANTLELIRDPQMGTYLAN